MADIETKMTEKSQENFVRENNVYILGPFDRSISSNVIPEIINLINILKFEKDPRINVYVNSCGGFACELFSLMAVIEIAKTYDIKIFTYNLGMAYSCGSLLAVIGDYRYMYKYATNLAHLGSSAISAETFEQLTRSANYINNHFNMIVDIYKKHVKCSEKKLKEILKDDMYFMNAETCLKLGFCDQII